MEEYLERYLKTCLRYEKDEVPKNEYMKRPYFERNIIQMYLEYHQELLKDKIHQYVMNRDLDEDDFYHICWLYPSLRKKREEWENQKVEVKTKVFIEKCIYWMIRYFQFYMICTEFLYTDHNLLKDEIKILYHPKETQRYIKKNKKKIDVLKRFVFLHNEILDLQTEFQKISLWISEIFTDHEIILFSQSVFSNIILFQKEISKEKEKKRWLSSFACMSNFIE
jgi:hypothetical protein